MKNIWSNYNLSIVLFFLFLGSWILQTYAGWMEFRAEQADMNHTAQWLGPSGYFWVWTRATFENWQSEFLQLLTFVSLTSFLIHKGSPESRDGDDQMRAALKRIEHKLVELEKSSKKPFRGSLEHRGTLHT